MSTSTVVVSDSLGAVKVSSNHFQIADSIQLGMGQLGDGLFPLEGSAIISGASRTLASLNGEVLPGAGLNVLVREAIALIDGVVLTGKHKDQFAPSNTTSLAVAANATSYVVLTATRITGDDGFDRADFTQAVPSVVSAPPDDSIVLANIVVPFGATQVTAAMIDMSSRKMLSNVDKLASDGKSASARLDGLDVAVLDLQTRVNLLGGQVSNLSGQVTVINGQVSTLQTQVSGLSTSVALQQAQIDALNASVISLNSQAQTLRLAVNGLSGSIAIINTQQALLSAQSAALGTSLATVIAQIVAMNAAIAALQSALAAVAAGQIMTSAQVAAVSAQSTALATAMTAIGAQVTSLSASVNNILAQGLQSLSLTVQGNIALVNFKIDSLTSAMANTLANGFSDVFSDLSGLDVVKSVNYGLASQGLILSSTAVAVPPTVPGFDALFHFDGSLVRTPGTGPLNQYYPYSGGNFGPLSFVQGVFGQAASLGAGAYFYSGLNYGGLSTPSQGTISCWINPGALPTTCSVVGASQFLELWLNGNSPAVWNPLTGGFLAVAPPLAPNVYSHVAMTWNDLGNRNTVFNIYVNGVLQATGSMAFDVVNWNYWGVSIHSTGAPLVGLDEVAMYSSILTPAQIATNATAPAALPAATVTSRLITAAASPTKVLVVPKFGGVVPTDVAFSVSRDNGVTFMPVLPNAVTLFTTQAAGTQLRLQGLLATSAASLRAWSLWWA